MITPKTVKDLFDQVINLYGHQIHVYEDIGIFYNNENPEDVNNERYCCERCCDLAIIKYDMNNINNIHKFSLGEIETSLGFETDVPERCFICNKIIPSQIAASTMYIKELMERFWKNDPNDKNLTWEIQWVLENYEFAHYDAVLGMIVLAKAILNKEGVKL